MVNNASAIQLTPVVQTDMRRFDLMHQINARGTFMVSKYAIPHLLKADNPHILMLSPPLDMEEKWFASAHRLRMAKFGMSLVVLGLAGELRGRRRECAVAAHHDRHVGDQELVGGDALMRMSRKPEILSDAASRSSTSRRVHRQLPDRRHVPGRRRRDRFRQYRADPTQRLQIDFFVPDDMPPPKGVSLDKLN